MKLSWRVENTGTKGISSFDEHGPLLTYPSGTIVVDSRIVNSSPLLNIGKKPTIDTIDNNISIGDLGIFNKQDFFVIDIYVRDLAESGISQQFLNEWNLKAKALDLNVKKESASSSEKDAIKPLDVYSYIIGSIAGVFSTFFALFISRKYFPKYFQAIAQMIQSKQDTQQQH